MSGYTKLFSSILASTIWREDNTVRIVWITLLAMAGKNGIAEGSVPGLADLARVSIPECEAALEKLMAPDKYSRTKDHDGRRIVEVDGGWQLLNHAKYRAKLSADERREYNRLSKQESRARKSIGNVKSCQQMSANVNDSQQTSIASMTVNDGQRQSSMSAHTEATTTTSQKKKEEEGSAKADGIIAFPKMPDVEEFPKPPNSKEYHQDARIALHWLNDKAGKRYRETDVNLSTISARLKEPEVTIEGVKKMIDRQSALWKGDPKMEPYLRPETLFGKQKFDGYYGQRDNPVKAVDGQGAKFERKEMQYDLAVKVI